MARALLEAKANIEAVNNMGGTALMLSAQNGHEQVCSHCPQTVTDVSYGSDVTNHEQVARNLLEANANIEAQTNKGSTALILSAENGHDQVNAYPDLIPDFFDQPPRTCQTFQTLQVMSRSPATCSRRELNLRRKSRLGRQP